jgi:hypothetical protein
VLLLAVCTVLGWTFSGVGSLRADLPAPLAYWNFDDNVDDQTGNGNDGTLMGDADYDADVPAAIGGGKSLILGGDATKTDYVDLSSHLASFAGLSQGTIAAWYKTPGSGVDVILAASQSTDGSSEIRFYQQDSRVRLDVREQDGATFVDSDVGYTSGSVTDDAWHHVAVSVESSSRASFYFDGVYVGLSDEPFFSSVNDLDTLSIGRNVDSSNSAGQWFFDGKIDDVAVWGTPLTCGQIAALAAGAAPDAGAAAPDLECLPVCDVTQSLPLPVGFWNFDDQVEDLSGFERDGTLVGGPVYDTDVPAAIGTGKSIVLDRSLEQCVDLSAHAGDFATMSEGTISAWIQISDLTIGVIFSVSNSADIRPDHRRDFFRLQQCPGLERGAVFHRENRLREVQRAGERPQHHHHGFLPRVRRRLELASRGHHCRAGRQ